MSQTDPQPYVIPVESKGGDVKVYKVHTPFNPAASNEGAPGKIHTMTVQSENPKNKYVSYDSDLGRSPGMATCLTCHEQVLTNVNYKVGAYAWLMCLLFICCGLIIGCCLIPFFLKSFKDAYHTCPKCQRIIHVEKKRCC